MPPSLPQLKSANGDTSSQPPLWRSSAAKQDIYKKKHKWSGGEVEPRKIPFVFVSFWNIVIILLFNSEKGHHKQA